MRGKSLIITILLSVLFHFSYAQPSIDAVDWSGKWSTKTIKVGETVQVIFTAPLPDEHHVYSNDFDLGDCGPQKTQITYKLKGAKAIGKPKPVGAEDYIDEIWEMVCESGAIRQFSHKAQFNQSFKITGEDINVEATISYQVCNESGCVSYDTTLRLTGKAENVSNDEPLVPSEGTDNPADPDDEGSENVDNSETGETDQQDEIDEGNSEESDSESAAEEVKPEDPDDVEGKSLWALFLLGMGGGLISLFTPCVFPMIPMTVAFFTKEKDKAKGRRMAVFYGLSIIGIYIILGMILAVVFGATFAYTLSTHWLPNIIFFLVFIIFSLAFFGMFEITLPSSFVNKVDQQGDRGGYVGVFFIAFTLVLVSFSCTAPIVGSVSILAASGAILKPLAAMLGFSIMFAVPFTLFAFFPQWLNSLPQSGGWLNSVKVFLGFAELALAFKFLSQADLVYHWGILDRDVFLGIWIVLAFLLGVYLLGKLKFPHDSDMDRVPVPRFLLAVAAFTFSIYMIPGLWGAPLKPLAGILPPMTTQDFKLAEGATSMANEEPLDDVRYSDILEIPHGLQGYFVYEDALAASKKKNKPVFVDFTGHSCANCRRMEEFVWPKPGVLSRLKEDFIIASLYVDERTELPKDEQYTNKAGKEITTLGQRNADIQGSVFKSQAQPYYYVVDHNGKVLAIGGGYDPDEQKFIDFLDKGKEEYKNEH
ncbi:thioredoxin fold domain-containing protein [bacterium]|nr:thioredoxin fold domain-containing protein [bacterium]